jgi:hypothetical protein
VGGALGAWSLFGVSAWRLFVVWFGLMWLSVVRVFVAGVGCWPLFGVLVASVALFGFVSLSVRLLFGVGLVWLSVFWRFLWFGGRCWVSVSGGGLALAVVDVFLSGLAGGCH